MILQPTSSGGYVLEGSTRKSGNRLRLTAQLIDAESADHVWAERYDRVIEDIFDLQDDITRAVVTALRVHLSDGESAALWNRGTTNIEAWRLVIQGLEALHYFHAEGMLRAREFASRASEVDPTYSVAWSLLGTAYWYEARTELIDDRDANLARAEECAEKATALDPDHPNTIGLEICTLILKERYEAALDVARRGLKANPGSADVRAYFAMCRHALGDSVEAVALLEEAKRLNPLHPIWYFPVTARALDASGNEKDALRMVEDGLLRQPDNLPCLLQLASLLGRQGEIAAAREALGNVRRLSPGFPLQRVDQWLITRDSAFKTRFKDGLRLAGLSG